MLGIAEVKRLWTSSRNAEERWDFVIPGRGPAREPGTHEHQLEKSGAWPVFMGSGLGPEGPPRNDSGVFPQPARETSYRRRVE
jgi:hypothetical protein